MVVEQVCEEFVGLSVRIDGPFCQGKSSQDMEMAYTFWRERLERYDIF